MRDTTSNTRGSKEKKPAKIFVAQFLSPSHTLSLAQ